MVTLTCIKILVMTGLVVPQICIFFLKILVLAEKKRKIRNKKKHRQTCNLYSVVQKLNIRPMPIILSNLNRFSTIFTGRLFSKFAVGPNAITKYLTTPHTRRTLPSETMMSKKQLTINFKVM